ncbi:T9SS type A sorting domain-containing protein [Kaistella polysaccharea]|uniref:T9SS type A sorting domain-containing protein n=1 Tax=Kaistella polysaccharea TaxID=2878534 RepID=UPI001CF40464|nr:T9SS type A sorting domain-containing protein [Kaistella polysaccharea]
MKTILFLTSYRIFQKTSPNLGDKLCKKYLFGILLLLTFLFSGASNIHPKFRMDILSSENVHQDLPLTIVAPSETVILKSVNEFTTNDYKTVGGSGQLWSDPAIWQKYNGSNGWNAAGADGIPPTTANVHIFGSVNSDGVRTANQIIIETGGILTVSGAMVSATKTLVRSGGSLRLNAPLTNNGIFEIDDQGTVNLNYTTASGTSALWNGIENFHNGSKLTIQNWNYTAANGANRLIQNPSQISANSDSYYFGNLIITGEVASKFVLINGAQNINLCQNDFTANGIGKNIIFTEDAARITVGGDVNIKDGQLSFAATGTGDPTLTIGGNLNIIKGIFNLNQTNSDTSLATVNVMGNYFVGLEGVVTSTDTNSTFNFAGKARGSTDENIQSIDFHGSALSLNNAINYFITDGAYVKLKNQDFMVGSGSKVFVQSNGSLDFGFNNSTALNLTRIPTQSSFTSGQFFEAQTGSTLKISSPDGINTGVSNYLGNVKIGATSSDRIFSSGANYHFQGKSNPDQVLAVGADQLSGNGLPTAELTGNIIIDLDTKSIGKDDVSFQSIGIHKFMSAGSLKIIKGKVIDNAGNGFEDEPGNNGNFVMMGGRYKISRGGTQPGLGGSYNLTCGVIEFAGNSSLSIRAGSPKYLNLEISGTNVSAGTGLNSGLTFQQGGTFTIKEGGVLKVSNLEGFAGNTSSAIKNSGALSSLILAPNSTIDYNRNILDEVQKVTSHPVTLPVGFHYQNLTISGKSKKIAIANTNIKGPVVVKTEGIFEIPTPTVITALDQINVENGGTFILNNDTNLMQSSATLQNDYIQNTGNITMVRNSPMKKNNYTYWSSPVSGANLKEFSPDTSIARFYEYSEPTNLFQAVSAASSFIPARGYAIMAPKHYTLNQIQIFNGAFKGVPNNGIQADGKNLEFPLSLSSGSNQGFNLVGNPYPSNIDFEKLFELNMDKIYNTVYFWTNVDPNRPGSEYGNTNYSGNAYAIYNGTGGVSSTAAIGYAGPEGPIPTQYIKVGQGFIVKAKRDGPLIFNNSIRNTSGAGHFFSKNVRDKIEKDRFWLKLTSPANNVSMLLIGYVEGATQEFEWDYDAPLFTLGSDSFYSILDDKKLGIQGRSFPLTDNDVVKLGTKHFEAGEYTISLGTKEGVFSTAQKIYLKDNDKNIIIDLSEGEYSFNSTSGEFTSRFEIIYRTENILSTENLMIENLTIYRDGEDVVVRLNPKNIQRVEVFDMSGRLILKNDNCRDDVRFNVSNIIKGTYIVKVITDAGRTLTKKFRND